MVLPSLLLCDFGNLEREVRALEAAGVRGFHLDVMDGHFVPNLTYGLTIVTALRRLTDLPLDVHLMISNPQDYLTKYVDAGADLLTIHAEAVDDPRPLLEEIHALGAGAGLAINPPTPVAKIEAALPFCDLVLAMSVAPGYGGQAFNEIALEKLSDLRLAAPNALLEVDGGVNAATIAACGLAGAQLLVVGSAIFREPDYQQSVAKLTQLAGSHTLRQNQEIYSNMLKLLLIRTGATEYEGQGRVQGTLDIPLSEDGRRRIEQVAKQLQGTKIDVCYAGPCRATQQSANILATELKLKTKTMDDLRNLDHGLWQGMLINDVKVKQPKVYRQWQEHPETVCPPEGESLQIVRERLHRALTKIAKKKKDGTAAVVVAEPIARLLKNALRDDALGNLWQAQGDQVPAWELIDVPAEITST